MPDTVLIDSFIVMTAVIYAAAAVRALLAWRMHGTRSLRWLAGALVLYAVANVLFSRAEFRLDRANSGVDWTIAFVALSIAPWMLFRLAAALGDASRTVRLAGDVLVVAAIVAQLAVPGRVALGYVEPTPGQALVHGLLALSTFYAIGAGAVLLWRGGHRMPGTVRTRYRMLAIAFPLLSLTQSASGVREFPAVLLTTFLLWTAIALLVVAAVPPRVLRDAWQAPLLRRVLRELADVSALTEATTIRTQLLPAIADVGRAQRVAVRDIYTGDELGAWGPLPRDGAPVHRLRIPASSIDVELVGTPHDPFFGREDIELVRDLGTHLDVALDRSRIIALERDAATALANANAALHSANADLRDLAELRDNFVAIASHELRTPITTIMGFTATMLDLWEQLDDERRRAYLEMVDRDARRLGQLVEDLLLLSSVESPDFRVEREAVVVLDLLREVLGDVGMSEELVELDVADATLAVDADPRHLRQVVGNLLANAIKHGAPPMGVRALAADGGVVRIEVSDAGPGIAPADREQVFERFARAGGTTVAGSGLGLFIVRRLAELQGGRAWYEDGGPGARFVVELARAG